MNKRLELIIQWLNERSLREQIGIAMVAIFFMYVIWHLIIDEFLIGKQKKITQQINIFKTELNGMNAELNTLLTLINQSGYTTSIKKQKNLSQQFLSIRQELAHALPNLTVTKNLPQVEKDLVTTPSNIVLLDLKRLDPTPWIPFGLNKNRLPENMRNITQHGFEIKISGSYFNIIDYFNYLEKLPWHLYWQSINYNVAQYPEGDVVLNVYVLT